RAETGRDQLGRLVPARADEAALPALGAPHGVGRDLRPRVERLEPGPRLAPPLEERSAHVRIADAQRRVDVPGEARAAWTPARLVVRLAVAVLGIVGLLRLPGDDPVLDVDLPRAGAGAVHAVRRADDPVVGPALPVERLPAAAALRGALPPRRAGF